MSPPPPPTIAIQYIDVIRLHIPQTMGDHMAEEPRTKMISMRFDIELMERIKAVAEREDRTFAAQLQRMLA